MKRGTKPAGMDGPPKGGLLLRTSLLLALSSAAQGQTAGGVGINNVDEVKLVIVALTEGYKTPRTFLPDDPNDPVADWTTPVDAADPNGPRINKAQLYGERQMFGFGRALRRRYGTFLSSTFDADEVRAVSSDEPTAQNSASFLLTGLYSEVAQPFLSARSLATSFQPRSMPRTMRPQNSQCASAEREFRRILNEGERLPRVQQWLQDADATLALVAQAYPAETLDLPFLEGLTDSVVAMSYVRLAYPDWLQRPQPPLDRFTIVEKLTELQEPIGSACAIDPECRQTQAGFLLSQVATILAQARSGVQPPPKMYIFTSHTEVVFSLMKLLDYAIPERSLAPGSGFILEYRETAYPEIRFVDHNSIPYSPSQHEFKLAEREPQCRVGGTIIDWCPLVSVFDRLAGQTIADQDAACAATDLRRISLSGLAQSGSFFDQIVAVWSMAAGDAARVARFELIFSPVGSRAQAQTVIVAAGESSATITGLRAGAVYNVELLAVGNNGFSDRLEELMRTRAFEAVDIVAMELVDSSSSSLKVMWEIDETKAAEVESFVLFLSPSADPSAAREESAAAGLRMFRFDGLRPDTSYDVSVQVRTAGGDSGPLRGVFRTLPLATIETVEADLSTETSEETITITTGGGCGPIRITSVDKIMTSPGGMLLGWTVMPDDVVKVEGFQIFLSPLVNQRAVKEISIRRPVFTRLLPDLTPETIYNVTVRALATCAPNSPAFSVWIITDAATTQRPTPAPAIRVSATPAPVYSPSRPPPPPPEPYRPPPQAYWTPQPRLPTDPPAGYGPAISEPAPPPKKSVAGAIGAYGAPAPAPAKWVAPPPVSWPASARSQTASWTAQAQPPPSEQGSYGSPSQPPEPQVDPVQPQSSYAAAKETRWAAPKISQQPPDAQHNFWRPPHPAFQGPRQGSGGGAGAFAGPPGGTWEIEANILSLKRRKGAQGQRGRPVARRFQISGVGCRDQRRLCAKWARAGHCDSNPLFMKPTCQASCDCCGCTLASVQQDLHKQFKLRPRRPPAPKKQAQKPEPVQPSLKSLRLPLEPPRSFLSSGGAGAFAAESGSRVEAPPAPRRPQRAFWSAKRRAGEEEELCADFNADCPFWALAGECEGNRRFMNHVCPASCDRCGK